MRNDYVLSCCSTADLSREQMEALGLEYICFHYELDGKPYLDDLGQSMSMKDFYDAMASGASTKTSQVNADEYERYFTGFAAQGKDILHVSLSSGISGTSNSARLAAEAVREKYPNVKIYVVDSLGASSGFGLIMATLSHKRDEGMDIDTLHDWIEENKLCLHHWFFSTDLTFYVRGGRISKASGFFGGMLGICPLLNMDNEGRLIPRQKIRGKAKVTKEIVQKMMQFAQDGTDYSGECFISQSACREDAERVAHLVQEKFPKLKGNVVINDIGTTIGSHTGPGTVALFFWGSKREN